MNDNLITVNYLDEEIGTGEKMQLHTSPILHRAFSVFICHEGKMFIHKRNKNKYHSGGLWTNSCCSHLRSQVPELECVRQRLEEELGISETPEYLTKFVYYHKFHEDLYEFEYDHVYLLDYNGPFVIDPDEIEDTAWVDIDFLANDIISQPEKYSVWFITAFGFVYKSLKD